MKAGEPLDFAHRTRVLTQRKTSSDERPVAGLIVIYSHAEVRLRKHHGLRKESKRQSRPGQLLASSLELEGGNPDAFPFRATATQRVSRGRVPRTINTSLPPTFSLPPSSSSFLFLSHPSRDISSSFPISRSFVQLVVHLVHLFLSVQRDTSSFYLPISPSCCTVVDASISTKQNVRPN